MCTGQLEHLLDMKLTLNVIKFLENDSKCNEVCTKHNIHESVTKKFPDWPPGTRTANGTVLCH
jgi:hypothetical protein